VRLAADERGIPQINSQKRSKVMKIETEFLQLSYPRNSAFIRGRFLLLLLTIALVRRLNHEISRGLTRIKSG